jgi:hypothetical protein
MAIIQTIDNASQFRDQFCNCGRGTQFSYEGLGLLYDYLNDCGSDVELDVIGICCEFIEQDYKDIFNTYDISCADDEPTDDDIKEAVVAYLEENTSIVGETSSGSFVFVQF